MREGLEGKDLSAVERRAARLHGEALWRSLDELADTPQFRQSVEREFPASYWDFDQGGTSRRNFMRLMGASMALAGLYGCSERPSGKILPYIQQPEQIVPGMPLYFATAMPINGYGHGVLAESHEGRPTKIEGNPDHPASRGATSAQIQASVLQLYDPERARTVLRAGVVSAWDAFRRELASRLDRRREEKQNAALREGKGIRILTGTMTSPTLAWQIGQFLKQFPQARWHHYDPLSRQNSQKGAIAAFGQPVNTVYQFRNINREQPEKNVEARVIVSLDCDFLWGEPGSLAYAREFAEGRKVRVRNWSQTGMSRLYVVESTFSLTGSMADHRIPARPSEMEAFARAIASRVGAPGATSGDVPAKWAKHLDAMVADLQKNKGACLVLVGESMPPEIHTLGHAINAALGNVGKTVRYLKPVERFPLDDGGKPVLAFDSLRQLVDDMNHGRVDTLLILGGNPAYDAPGDLKFADALFRLTQPQQRGSFNYVNFTAHLGLYDDETSFLCQWSVPEAHYLESWGDVLAYDGTASIIQPLIAPLYQGRTAVEVMDAALTPEADFRYRTGYEIVRQYWQTQGNFKPDEFEGKWTRWLEKGVIEDYVPDEAKVSLGSGGATGAAETAGAATTQPAGTGELEVVFRPDPGVWDGTFSNNGWLQECPKFFTKLTWDNAAFMSFNTAKTLRDKYPDLADGHVLKFTYANGQAVLAPVMVLPGLPDGVITMHFGYGRTRGGTSATEPDGKSPRGFNAYRLRHSRSPWIARGVAHERTGGFHRLVTTHGHNAIDTLTGAPAPIAIERLTPEVVADPATSEADRELRNRKLVRTATLAYFNESPENRHFVREIGGKEENNPLTIYPAAWDYSKGYQWGMSIDMQSCIGCNACLVACVSENNIAVVGREEVARQREMHWIRIDDYFGASLSKERIKEIQEGRADAAELLENPRVYHQPVPCMHCENAPCELVCPVGATAHSPEGLNDMVYNRCVGTRYCSNNCPYKVRRFNFFNWMKDSAPEFDLQHNPQVTVRTRGVMEKCTYCVQRITYTRIEIEKMIVRTEERIAKLTKEMDAAPDDRKPQLASTIRELERERHNREFETLERLQTACQQACPTHAIWFGHIRPVQVVNDNGEKEMRLTHVTKLKQEPLDYPLLAELTTVPRTTYMARLRNPNPDLEPNATS